MEVHGANGIDVEALVNQAAAEFSKSDLEEKKVTQSRIRVNTKQMAAKRQERIENLADQIRGVSSGGGCFKFLRVVFKIIDVIAKPLSALSLNQLKLDLTKTLDMLKEAKGQKAMLLLRAKGDDILKSLEGLKKLFSDDMEALKNGDEQSANESQRILQILDEIETTFKATNRV